MERWRGKVAIVTGASCGIGACVAEKLVQAGLLVVGFARRPHLIEEHAKRLSMYKGKLHACKVDMTIDKEVIAAFQWTLDNVGPVHVLVNNAGLMLNTGLLDGDTELWRKVLETNILGVAIATREACKIMFANKIDGHVIHVNSILGHKVVYFQGVGLYGSSKFAVTSYHESLRQELKSMNSKIKLSCISPGKVATHFFDDAAADVKERIKKETFLQAEDVANGILYMLGTPPHVQIHDLIIQPVGD